MGNGQEEDDGRLDRKRMDQEGYTAGKTTGKRQKPYEEQWTMNTPTNNTNSKNQITGKPEQN